MSGQIGKAKQAASTGRLSANEITTLASSLQHAFPVSDAHAFDAILREIDAAEETSDERPK